MFTVAGMNLALVGYKNINMTDKYKGVMPVSFRLLLRKKLCLFLHASYKWLKILSFGNRNSNSLFRYFSVREP